MTIAIAICTHNRPVELALLLTALRFSKTKPLDIYIMEDRSSQPITNFHFVNCIIARLKDEGHNIIYEYNNVNVGLPRLRQRLVDKIIQDPDVEYILPIDDDVIPDADYIEKLMEGIERGFDFCSGVIPPMMQPSWKRTTDNVKPMFDIWDGNIMNYGLDAGHTYDKAEIIPTHHFRSGGLGTRKFWENASYPDYLGNCSFREEDLLALDGMKNGMKYCVNTGAIIWHMMTPSGGNRDPHYEANIKNNMVLFENKLQQAVDEDDEFLKKYDEEVMKLVA